MIKPKATKPKNQVTITPDDLELTINKGGIFAQDNGRICSLKEARAIIDYQNLERLTAEAEQKVALIASGTYEISAYSTSIEFGCQTIDLPNIRKLDRILRRFGA